MNLHSMRRPKCPANVHQNIAANRGLESRPSNSEPSSADSRSIAVSQHHGVQVAFKPVALAQLIPCSARNSAQIPSDCRFAQVTRAPCGVTHSTAQRTASRISMAQWGLLDATRKTGSALCRTGFRILHFCEGVQPNEGGKECELPGPQSQAAKKPSPPCLQKVRKGPGFSFEVPANAFRLAGDNKRKLFGVMGIAMICGPDMFS